METVERVDHRQLVVISFLRAVSFKRRRTMNFDAYLYPGSSLPERRERPIDRAPRLRRDNLFRVRRTVSFYPLRNVHRLLCSWAQWIFDSRAKLRTALNISLEQPINTRTIIFPVYFL